MDYDTLIVATGATHHYFGHDEWEHYAPGLKTVEDATEIRRRILLAFEAAYSRQPTAQELDIAKKSIAEDSEPKEGLRLFLQAMMGANDFLYSY